MSFKTSTDTIEFDILPPHWESSRHGKEYVKRPTLLIMINGENIFYKDGIIGFYAPISLEHFMQNMEGCYGDGDHYNGSILLGVCSDCGVEGCCDFIAEASTKEQYTTWRIKDEVYQFDKDDYKKKIEALVKEIKDKCCLEPRGEPMTLGDILKEQKVWQTEKQ